MARKRRSTRGSITKVGPETYRIAFRAGTDPVTGKPVRVSEQIQGITRADAQKRLTQLLREHDVSGVVPDREQTVASFARAWLEHVRHRTKPSTHRRYTELLQVHVLPPIGRVRLTEVRALDVQRVVDHVLEIRAPRTALNVLRVTSQMLAEAVRWGVIPANPAAAVRPPRAPRPKLNVPNRDACGTLLRRVRGRSVEGPVVLALGTGARLGEILALRWRDIDLERKVLRVTATLAYPSAGEYSFASPKTSRARRSIDLPAFVVTFLRRHRRQQSEGMMSIRDLWIDEDLILDNGIGEPMSPWTVSADFRRVVHELGLPRTRFHDLRHAFATEMLAAGQNVKAVSEQLGHSSTSFTMDTYSAVIPSMGRAVADAADQLFGAQLTRK
jgi:integrase